MNEPVHKKQENRELIELLNELRIVLPGVQVLFAFLLTVPLTGRFEGLTTFEKRMYVIAFFASAAAAVMLVAPSAYHRIRWRKGDKEALLITSNRLAVIGLAFLAVAMVAVVGLVTDLITTDGLAVLLTALAAVFIGVLWFAIPLSRRYRVDRNHGGDA
jgi:hypothetical protein